jgi:hypothetical protein
MYSANSWSEPGFKPDDPGPIALPGSEIKLNTQMLQNCYARAGKKRSRRWISQAIPASVTTNLNSGHISITFFY